MIYLQSNFPFYNTLFVLSGPSAGGSSGDYCSSQTPCLSGYVCIEHTCCRYSLLSGTIYSNVNNLE